MSIDVKKMTPLLQVFDMPASIAFYRDLLGFEVVHTSGGEREKFWWAQLHLGGATLMLNTAYDDGERPAERDLARTASHGDTVLYFDSPEVDATYAYLRERGLDVQPPEVTFYGAKQLYVKDPDGYSLCFQWYAVEKSTTE